MSKKNIIVVLGLLIAVMPFLGFPGVLKEAFFLFAGIAVSLLGYFFNDRLLAEDAENLPNNEEGKGASPDPDQAPILDGSANEDERV